MKRLNITYDTAEIENGEKIVGETCYTVEFADDLAGRHALFKPAQFAAVV